MELQLAPQQQKQVFLPVLSLWLPAIDWPPDYIPDKPNSYHFANVPAQYEHFEESNCHEYLHNQHISSAWHNILLDAP